jgi:hypothetical protein
MLTSPSASVCSNKSIFNSKIKIKSKSTRGLFSKDGGDDGDYDDDNDDDEVDKCW